MFYHALTGNGGTTPTENLEPVLLWTNSNPTTNFDAQTISLDLTDYAGVIVEFNRAVNNTWLANRSYIKKGETKLGAGNMHSKDIAARNASCNDSGVTFEKGYGNNGVDNADIIPIKIYGIKEYVVEPQIGDLLWTNPNPTTAFTPQKLSVDLSSAKGAIIEVMISTTTQTVCSKQLVYKGDGPIGLGYSAGGVAQTRNIASVEADGITFETGYDANTPSNTVLIPYKIYAIN